MYKYSNKEHTTVTNLNTGATGIHPGVWLWEEYQTWLENGGVTEAFDTRTADEILESIKSDVWLKIKAERDSRMDGGFKVEVEPGVFKWFHSDQKSRIQHLGLKAAGESLGAISWKTMDGTFVTMTPTIANLIFTSAMTLDNSLHVRAEEHKALMNVSVDPESYDFSTGWPERFVSV